MVLQGGPEVPKLFPKVLPRRQNGHPRCSRAAKMITQDAPGMPKLCPEMLKRRHQALQMASEEKKKHDMLKWMLARSQGVKMVSRDAEIE